MKRSINVRWGKLRVGIMVMFAVAMALWASMGGGGTSVLESKKEAVAYFKNVNGLLKGSPVWMAGVEVGNVKSVDFVNLDADRVVKVVFRVKKGVWSMITEDSDVSLGTIGFLGDKYVEVYPGTPGLPVIQEGTTLPTRQVGDANQMIQKGTDALSNVGQVVNGLDTMLTRMNRGEGTLGRLATDSALYANMTTLLADLTKLARGLQDNQARITGSIEKMADATKEVSAQVAQTNGTVGRLFNDSSLYVHLNSTSAHLDSIMMKINDPKGSVGLLVNDTALYTEMTNLMQRVNNLMDDISKDPKSYFKFSVF